MTDQAEQLPRRSVLQTTAAAVAGLGALAGCSGGGGDGGGGGGGDSPTDSPAPTTESGSGGGSAPSFDGYLEGVSNYDGVEDLTGSSEVTVEVGVEANGGAFGFGPPAVRVDAGTTVVWEWTGQGGSHNVVAESGEWESELVSEQGHTYSRTFDSAGTVKYFCEPHRSLGMKGVVVVE